MDGGRKSSSCGRVVVLSLDDALAAIGQGDPVDLEVVRTDTAYEAAAELLAAPTSAFVVDLHLLASRHLRVLEIARRMDAEMLAVGALSGALSADDLSGVRLVSRQELPGVLQSLAGRTESSMAEAARQTPESLERPGPALPAEEPKLPVEQQTATGSEVSSPREEREAEPDAPASEPGPSPQERRHRTRRSAPQGEGEGPPAAGEGGNPKAEQTEQPRPPQDLLTPEELSALLGDES